MRNGLSIKCNREGAAAAAEFDVDDIHGKRGEGEVDVSQHSQSYKFQEPFYAVCPGNLRSQGKRIGEGTAQEQS